MIEVFTDIYRLEGSFALKMASKLLSYIRESLPFLSKYSHRVNPFLFLMRDYWVFDSDEMEEFGLFIPSGLATCFEWYKKRESLSLSRENTSLLWQSLISSISCISLFAKVISLD